MTTYRVTMENSGGELDAKLAHSETEAAQVLIAMIESAGELYDGDRFYVREVETA